MPNRVELLALLTVSTLAATGCASDGADQPLAPAPAVAAPAPTPDVPGSSAAAPAPAAPPTAAAPANAAAGEETWGDAKQLGAQVEIPAGSSVRIAAGARISLAQGAVITVRGTLSADAQANHAALSGDWRGIVVEDGGSMMLEGVDLVGATQGIRVTANALIADYNYGTLSGGGAFTVETNGELTTHHAAVRMGGSSVIRGSFTASFLDYQGVEINLSDPAATATVSDSKLTGVGGDFFTATSGRQLRVEYSTVDNTHCPFHFLMLERFEIDHVTTGGTAEVSTDGFGVMFYMPDMGPHTISYSNFNDPSWAQTEATAEFEITNTYIRNMEQSVGKLTFTPAGPDGQNGQTSPNPDAQPRGTPGPG